MGSQRHIQSKAQRILFPDTFRGSVVIDDETQSQHTEHLFEQNTVYLRKSVVTVYDYRGIEDAVSLGAAQPVPVFGYFIPVAYQHIQQAFTDIKHLIYLKILVGLYGIQQFFRQENIRTGIEIRYINNANQLIFDRRPVGNRIAGRMFRQVKYPRIV